MNGCSKISDGTTINTPFYSYNSQSEDGQYNSSSAWGLGPIKYVTSGKDKGLHLKYDIGVGNGNLNVNAGVDVNVSRLVKEYYSVIKGWFE